MFSLKRIAPPLFALIAALSFAVWMAGRAALLRAEAALQTEDYRSAAEAYARAARLLFWRQDLLEKAALAAVQSQEYPAAIYYFERAAELSPRGLLALGYAYYHVGDLQAAHSAFERGAQRSRSAPFYEGLALVYRLQNRWEDERRAVERQIELDAGSASAHYRLGVLLTLLDPDLALPELMLAASLDPRFDSPVQTLRAALNLSAVEPNAAEQSVNIGRALGLIAEWELARAAFQKAADLDPQNAKARAWLGEAKQHLGEDARADLDLALRLDPKSPIARGLSALDWERRGDYRRALTEYLLAAQYDPQNPVWQLSLAGAYVQTGELVLALAAFQRATELEPNEAAYWRELAFFCAENGVSVEEIGLPAAQRAVALAPQDPLALDALGYVYYATGRHANAQKILTDLSARFPNLYAAQIHLALNFIAQGDDDSARRVLTSVRIADPDGADGALAARLLQKYFP